MARKSQKPARPKPLATTPKPPTSLGQHGKGYWQRVAPLLVQLGRLTDLSLEPLEALCRQWDLFKTFDDWVRKHPSKLVFETEKGYQAEAPQLRLRAKAFDALCKLWPRFGLTPEGDVTLARKGSGRGTGKRSSAIAEFAAGKYDDQ